MTLRIGASSAADMCGHGYNSIQELWRIKTKRKERPEPTAYMLHGVGNEHRAIIATECDLGRIWTHTGDDWSKQYCFRMKTKQAELVCHPDGVDLESRECLEVKCPVDELRDEVPLKYLIQMQFGLMLSGFERYLYAEWKPAETRKWWVYPNFEFQEILDKYTMRFLEFVEKDEEPPRWSSKKNPKPEFPEVKTERV